MPEPLIRRCWRTNKLRYKKRDADRLARRWRNRVLLRRLTTAYCVECGGWHILRLPR